MTTKVKLTLTQEEIIYMINLLATQPYRTVAPLIKRLEDLLPKSEVNEDSTPA